MKSVARAMPVAGGSSPSPHGGGETAQLVRAARAGDREAFGRLVELHQRSITRLAWRLLGDRDEADSAAQDAFLQAWGSLGEFREGFPFGAWIAALFGVDVGTIKTHLSRASRRIRRSLEALYGPRLPF